MREKILTFQENLDRYDSWYDRHREIFLSELKAVSSAHTFSPRSLEIGVGTGRFSSNLNISFGVDPCFAMLRLAQQRGTEVVAGVGEQLPFKDHSFDDVLIAITICFVEDPLRVLKECRRVLKKGGKLVLAYIDRESAWGKFYERRKEENPFYRFANFYSTDEIEDLLSKAGFKVGKRVETLFAPPGLSRYEIEEPREGRAEGSLVVLVAVRD